MVPVVVRENDFLNIRQIDVKIAGVLEHGVRVRSGIDQNAVPVRLDKRGKTPFAETNGIANQHGGQDGDLECVNLPRVCLRVCRAESAAKQEKGHT